MNYDQKPAEPQPKGVVVDLTLNSREQIEDVVFKTSSMKKGEELLKKVQERINREKFERQYIPLPQHQLMQPLTQEVQQNRQNLRQTYEMRGIRPAWRPIVSVEKEGEPGASLELTTAQRFIHNSRNHVKIVTEEVPIDGSSGEHPGLIEILRKHCSITCEKTAEIGLPNTEAKIHSFCKDLAIDVVQNGIQIQLQKRHRINVDKKLKNLNDEFFVICLLNILYGDPRVPLLRLHPIFQTGNQPRPIDFNRQLPHLDEVQPKLGKIQRNALINLLQLMQRIDNPIPMVKGGQDVLSLVKNGEMSRAVQALNLKGKGKLALLLAQAVQANREVQQQMKQVMLTSNAYSDPKDRAIFDWVLEVKGEGTWQQKLLGKLLFREASCDFHEIVANFFRTDQQGLDMIPDTFFAVLQTWKNFADGSYNIVASRIGNSEDHLTHWLVALVERMHIVTREGIKLPADPNFDELCVKLSQQFLREHMKESDYIFKSLLVLLFTEPKVQQKALLDIMLVVNRLVKDLPDGGEMIGTFAAVAPGDNAIDAFQQSVGFSSDYTKFARAQEKLAKGEYESVILDYLELQRSGVIDLDLAEMSHQIFIRHVLVKNFKDEQSIDKLLLRKVNFSHARKQAGEPDGFCFTSDRRKIDRVLKGLKTYQALIQEWDKAGGVFHDFLIILDQWQEVATEKMNLDLLNSAREQVATLIRRMQVLPIRKGILQEALTTIYVYMRQVDERLAELAGL